MQKLLSILQRCREGATPERINFYLAGYLLTQVLLFLFLEATPGVLDRQERVRGRDFLNFYVNGQIVAEGQEHRLYDRDYFLAVQTRQADISPTRPRYYPLYPPMTALLFSSLGKLPYGTAIVLWWTAGALLFLVAGAWALREIQPAQGWRSTTWLALAAFTPVFSTFLNGQLVPVLLVVLIGGLELHRRGRGFWAGCLLSLLALKPQFAVGVFLWLLFRRDKFALAGLFVGLAAQAGLVAGTLGPEILLAYVQNARIYVELGQIDLITPDHQHSLAGILTNLAGRPYSNWCKLIHLGVTAVAAVWLFQTVRQSRQTARAGEGGGKEREYAAVVLFSLFWTPHLLTYDLSLLIVPLAFLWSRRGRESGEASLGVVLYLAALPTFLYYFLGFSLVPAALLWGLWRAAQRQFAGAPPTGELTLRRSPAAAEVAP